MADIDGTDVVAALEARVKLLEDALIHIHNSSYKEYMQARYNTAEERIWRETTATLAGPVEDIVTGRGETFNPFPD